MASYLISAIVMMVIFGFISHKLAVKKGYTGYFWTGFFLSVVGLIYVAGLPMSSAACDISAPNRDGDHKGKPRYCAKCGAKNGEDVIFCTKCGESLFK